MNEYVAEAIGVTILVKTRKMITLNEEQVKQLEAILAEMPMKFGVPVLNILNAAAKAENTDAED